MLGTLVRAQLIITLNPPVTPGKFHLKGPPPPRLSVLSSCLPPSCPLLLSGFLICLLDRFSPWKPRPRRQGPHLCRSLRWPLFPVRVYTQEMLSRCPRMAEPPEFKGRRQRRELGKGTGSRASMSQRKQGFGGSGKDLWTWGRRADSQEQSPRQRQDQGRIPH